MKPFNNQLKVVHCITLLSVLFLLLSACSQSIRIDQPPAGLPLIDPVPLTALVQYDDSIVNHNLSEEGGWLTGDFPNFYTPAWQVTLGPPTMEYFNKAYNAIFEHVVFANADEAHASVNLFVEQQLEYFRLACGPTEREFAAMACDVNLSYRITASSPQGEILEKWLITSKASAISGPAILAGFMMAEPHIRPLRGQAISAAIHDAVAQFIKAFNDSTLAGQLRAE